MTALEYFETKQRMTKDKYMVGACTIECLDCGLGSENNGTDKNCRRFEIEHPKQAIEIVQKWRDNNVGKTLKDKMLEILPNVRLNSHGVPDLCPESLGLLRHGVCKTTNCTDCWNLPYKEV